MCTCVSLCVRARISIPLTEPFLYLPLSSSNQGGGFARDSVVLNGDGHMTHFYDDARTMYEFLLRGVRVSSRSFKGVYQQRLKAAGQGSRSPEQLITSSHSRMNNTRAGEDNDRGN